MIKRGLSKLLKRALDEDMPKGDISTRLMVANDKPAEATLISKDTGIFFGQQVIEELFKYMDLNTSIDFNVKDADEIIPGQEICTIKSTLKGLLEAERVMLNFTQRLSGVATITHQYVKALNNPKIKVMDTRKTTPLMRALEKDAVKAGGGHNHRVGLSDMVLIKENHLSALNQQKQLAKLPEIIKHFKSSNPNILVEIEAANVQLLEKLPLENVDIVMFDNFSMEDIHKGIGILKKKGISAEIEVSGNVNLDTIQLYSALDIHRISIGRLTHSVKALDLSLLIL